MLLEKKMKVLLELRIELIWMQDLNYQNQEEMLFKQALKEDNLRNGNKKQKVKDITIKMILLIKMKARKKERSLNELYLILLNDSIKIKNII